MRSPTATTGSSATSRACSRRARRRSRVARLRCLRGIDTLTAVGLVLGGRRLRAVRPGGAAHELPRAGPVRVDDGAAALARRDHQDRLGHVRRLLVEAAWHYRVSPSVGRSLSDRQRDQPPEAIAGAWRVQRRLHRTWARLEAPAKRRTVIAVAAARELTGFCWAITQIK